jgi:hypothetical protein
MHLPVFLLIPLNPALSRSLLLDDGMRPQNRAPRNRDTNLCPPDVFVPDAVNSALLRYRAPRLVPGRSGYLVARLPWNCTVSNRLPFLETWVVLGLNGDDSHQAMCDPYSTPSSVQSPLHRERYCTHRMPTRKNDVSCLAGNSSLTSDDSRRGCRGLDHTQQIPHPGQP